MKRIFFLVALSVGFSSLFAQSPVISTSVDKKKILIGEQIHLKLQATFSPSDYRLKWFEFPENPDHFEVISVDDIDTSAGESAVTLAQTFILTSFDSGRRVIPPLKLSVQQRSNNQTFSMYSDSIAIDVTYSPTDSIEPFHDIKNIIEVKKEKTYWKYILYGLIAVVIAVAVFLIIRKHRKRRSEAPAEAFSLDPYREAIAALEQLKKEDLLEKQEVKEFYGRLSGIFKRFLSGKTLKSQMNLTTDEIVVLLADKGVDRYKTGQLASALKVGDAVKFAKFTPSIALAEESLELIESMVEALKNMDTKTVARDI